jgi:hypothetical protein
MMPRRIVKPKDQDDLDDFEIFKDPASGWDAQPHVR